MRRVLGQASIVMMLPQTTTTKPARRAALADVEGEAIRRTGQLALSLEAEYCVLAMQPQVAVDRVTVQRLLAAAL